MIRRSHFGDTEENPLVSPGSNDLEDLVLLRLVCGAVSAGEDTLLWAPVLDFLYQLHSQSP